MKKFIVLTIILSIILVKIGYSQIDYKFELNQEGANTNTPYNKTIQINNDSILTVEIPLNDKHLEDIKAIDVDNDGIDELAVLTNHDGSTQIGQVIIYKWENSAFHIFWSSNEINGYPFGMQIADVDGDGYSDILASCSGTKLFLNKITYFKSVGNVINQTPDGEFAVADLNNDNRIDIGAGEPGYNSGYVNIFKQDSVNQHFSLQTTLSNGTNGNNMVTKINANNDKLEDLLIGELYSGDVYIYQNHKKFSFSKSFFHSFGTRIFNINSGDFDNDGKDDFIVAEAWANLHFFRNEGDTFNIVYSGSNIGSTFSTEVKDINNDNKIDVVAATFKGNIYLYENLGKFNFKEIHSSLNSSSNYGLAIGDFDGDGKDDIAYGTDPVLISFNCYAIFGLKYSNPRHFIPIWSGNPYQPMAILVKDANLLGDNLQPYDEIGIFTKDSQGNEVCVGDGKVTTPVGGKTPLNITVSADDPATTALDGFKNGSPIYYKIWSNEKQRVFSHVAAIYNKDYDTLFHTLGTAIVRLYGYDHYQPAWSGNPYQPMNVLIDSIKLPAGTTLQPGDEVGLFDTDTSGNDICVGAGIVSGAVSPQHPLSIVASSDDPVTPEIDGFTAHHGIIFKVWSADSIEYTNFSLKYNPAFDSLYTPLGTALVGLSYINTLNQKIPLSKGWNMMSLYVTPDSLGMLKVLKPLVSSGSLVKAIDEKGGFVQNIPGVGWMNTIGDMANTEGYYIKVTKNDTLKATGLPVDLPFAIPLQTGWNLMGYPVQSGQNAMKTLKTLIDSSQLVKVINEAGGFIQNIPGVGWMNTIGNFEPGEGYYVKVSHNTQITFNKPAKEAFVPAPGNTAYVMPVSKYFSKAFKGNPYYPMNIVVTGIDLDGLEVHAGDEIAAFDKDVCVGVGIVPKDPGLPVNIVASLDDPSTEQTDGFVPGDDITLRYMSPELGSPVTVTSSTLSGVSVFTPLETRVYGIAASAKSIKSHLKNAQNAFRAYPNPASSSVTFLLGNKENTQVEIELTDINGRVVRVFCNKTLPDGTHTLHYDLSGLPAGIYNVRVLRRSENNTSLNNYKLVIAR